MHYLLYLLITGLFWGIFAQSSVYSAQPPKANINMQNSEIAPFYPNKPKWTDFCPGQYVFAEYQDFVENFGSSINETPEDKILREKEKLRQENNYWVERRGVFYAKINYCKTSARDNLENCYKKLCEEEKQETERYK